MTPHGTVKSHRDAAGQLRVKAGSFDGEVAAWLELEADQHDRIADELMRLEALSTMRDIAEFSQPDPEVSRSCNSRSAAAG